MGGSLGPVLANIILTEFERIIINPLIIILVVREPMKNEVLF